MKWLAVVMLMLLPSFAMAHDCEKKAPPPVKKQVQMTKKAAPKKIGYKPPVIEQKKSYTAPILIGAAFVGAAVLLSRGSDDEIHVTCSCGKRDCGKH